MDHPVVGTLRVSAVSIAATPESNDTHRAGKEIPMIKTICSAVIVSAIMLAACTPQEHQTLAEYHDAETRIALPPDTSCYNDAFNAWTVAETNEGAFMKLRLDEIYADPSIPPGSPGFKRATDDVFAHYHQMMEYHTGGLVQRSGWTDDQVQYCKGIWNHISQGYDCTGIEERFRYNSDHGLPPNAWDIGVFHYCANVDPEFLRREFKTK